MPVRDARVWLGAALRSLWRQTVGDFEVIAVDDGSVDGSGEMLDAAAARDGRLRVVHTERLGLPHALNTGLALARAPLVARQDADDVSHPRRFELQLETLAREPELAVVGTRVRLFPAAATGPGMRRWGAWHDSLLDHAAMHRERFIDSPLLHGTAIVRREWLERVHGWAERGWAEDLDLWLRLFDAGARFGKRPEALYGWRQHAASATRRDPRYRRERFVALKLDALERGLLRGAARMTLVGVGDSLDRCAGAFGARRAVRVVRAGRPGPGIASRLEPPVVMVFNSAVARRRWREALANSDLSENIEFVFIA